MITKIPIEELKVGMFVEDTGLSWMDHPYLYAKEGEIASVQQVQTLLKEGYKEVFINTEKGTLGEKDAVPAEAAVESTLEKIPPRDIQSMVPLGEELGVAETVYKESLVFAKKFIASVQAGDDFDYVQSEAMVDGLMQSLSRNADALISLSKLRQFDEYTYTHCINVSVFSMAYARYLERSSDYIKALGIAALFHDIGKARIPSKILNKPSRLTDDEFTVMKRHPLESFQLIKDKTLSEQILRGIVEHHERYDGNGYPRGLKGEEQHPFARIIAVADVYDALTSDRVYKKGMLPNKALSLMYSLRGKDFYPGMVDKFIKCLGIYPIGSLVRLSSNNHAVVCGSHAHAPLRPTIVVAYDREMNLQTPEKIDLSLPVWKELKIVECLDAQQHGVDPLSVIDGVAC